MLLKVRSSLLYEEGLIWLSENGLNASNSAPSKDGGEELDQVAGNTEDEIGDLIVSVREDEMMYSPLSLLATFGPMIAHICLNPAMFKVCVCVSHPLCCPLLIYGR